MDAKDTTNNETTRVTDTKRALIYLVLVFVLTYIYEFIFVVIPIKTGSGQNIANRSLWVALAMFMPAVCVFITRIVTKEGFKDPYLNFRLKEGRYRYYLIAWFVPALITVLGTLLYFVFFKDDFSKDMKFFIDTLEGQGVSGITPEAARITIISQAVTAILIGPVLNCITCFGEEWGWRGYLLVKLKDRFKPLPLVLVTGVIWGIWHLPLILVGHNYGTDYPGYPYLGIIAMIIFCITMGTLFSFVTLKSGSCIPAVIGHGAINSFAAIGVYFTTDGGHMLFGPSPTGLIAGIPLLILAVIIIWFMNKNEEIQK